MWKDLNGNCRANPASPDRMPSQMQTVSGHAALKSKPKPAAVLAAKSSIDRRLSLRFWLMKKWIFFDCFNTLLDDFDETGDESGLSSVIDLLVEEDFCSSPDEFVRAYAAWRKLKWSGDDWQEVHLPDRLSAILASHFQIGPKRVRSLVLAMIERFEVDYPKCVRPTPGVWEMLNAWYGKVRMGVVSNFYLPGWPERLLNDHGFADCFDFIVDSATIGWKKPGRRIYIEALNQAGVSPAQASEVLFIGDSLENDVRAPQGLGMRVLYLDRSSDRPSPTPPADIRAITHWDQFRPSVFEGWE